MHVSQKFRFKAPDNQNCVLGSTLGRLRYSTAQIASRGLLAISNTESLPQADYYSLDVCPSPLSGYLQHGHQQKYLVRFWLTIFSYCNFIICPRKGKLKFLKVCKILKRTTHFKTDWILCVLNCSGCSHVVNWLIDCTVLLCHFLTQ